jgi:acyl dehydratase
VGIRQPIDLFAEATGDHQWIHVDPEQAADGPFGATIAHGYLTLSLVNAFMPEIFWIDGPKMGVNVGLISYVPNGREAPVDAIAGVVG